MADPNAYPCVKYEGELNAAGLPDGRGTAQFANGPVYEGQWKAAALDGHGTMRYVDGGVYETLEGR